MRTRRCVECGVRVHCPAGVVAPACSSCGFFHDLAREFLHVLAFGDRSTDPGVARP